MTNGTKYRTNLLILFGFLISAAIGIVAGVFAPSAIAKLSDYAHRFGRPGDVVLIPKSGTSDSQYARFFSAEKLSPLVVDLHQWSESEAGYAGNDAALDVLVAEKGWNFIRPALAGPNRSVKACCSSAIIDGINAAITYALENGKVDSKRIYVVGVSGGGYTSLCAASSGKVNARAFYAWASVTDLVTWQRAHAGDRYGADVLQCTGSKETLNVAEAQRRSPFYQPLASQPVHMYAGVNDGFEGSVLSSHSIKMFNRYALEHDPGQAVTYSELLNVVEGRFGPDSGSKSYIGGRQVHLARRAGPASLVLFEGGHEMLAKPMLDEMVRDSDSLIRSRSTKPQ